MAPDLWMRGTQVKPNSPKCLLNIANLNNFLLLGLLVHHKHFFHLEPSAGAKSEEEFLCNLKEKTEFKLLKKKKKGKKRCVAYFRYLVIIAKVVSYLQVSHQSLPIKAFNRKHYKTKELGRCLHSPGLH